MAPQQEWFEKDYYKILGVKSDAGEKDITKAYRKLAREFHPDANPNNAAAEKRFKEIANAYAVIGDSETRKEYDQVRTMGPIGNMGRGGQGFNGGQSGFNFQGDIGDIFGGLFNRGGRGGAPSGAHTSIRQPTRGNDLETEAHLSFADAVHGRTMTLHVTSDAICQTCDGSGAKPGTSPTTCARCRGTGVVDQNQGPFSFSVGCPDCGGVGTTISHPCSDCRGSGIVRRPRQVTSRIPPGVQDGQKIRLKGKGTPGRFGGDAGDLYIRVSVATDPNFGREGKNLKLHVPITFVEAVEGTNLKVPTFDGPSVTLKLPPGTPSGKVFRIRGKGITTKAGVGDLLVTVDVVIPTKLTTPQQKAIETMQSAFIGSPRTHLDALIQRNEDEVLDNQIDSDADSTEDAVSSKPKRRRRGGSDNV